MKTLLILLSILSIQNLKADNIARFSELHGKFFQVQEAKIYIDDALQLSGEQTKIEEVIALRENAISNTLLIQHRKEDQSEEILFFDLKELGKIQPHQILGDSSLKNSIDHDWDDSTKTLFVLQHSPNQITLLDGKRNLLVRGSKAQMRILKQYTLETPYQSMALMAQGLIALLSPEAKVHFYSISTMQRVQTIELQIPKETLDSVTLQWRSDLKELHVIQDQKIIDRLGL